MGADRALAVDAHDLVIGLPVKTAKGVVNRQLAAVTQQLRIMLRFHEYGVGEEVESSNLRKRQS